MRTPNDTRLAVEADERQRQRRYAQERRRQLVVLTLLAALVLLVSIVIAGPRNVFLPGWWRIDLP